MSKTAEQTEVSEERQNVRRLLVGSAGAALSDLDRDALDDYRHRLIYDAACDLVDAGDQVDVVTVSDRLQDVGRLREAGGIEYLTHLVDHGAGVGQ